MKIRDGINIEKHIYRRENRRYKRKKATDFNQSL